VKQVLVLAALSLALPATGAEPVWVGRFPAEGAIPSPWQIEQMNKNIPPTVYRLREWGDMHAVEAHAVKSMALLARPVDINLAKTPVLCWRWRIQDS